MPTGLVGASYNSKEENERKHLHLGEIASFKHLG